MIEENKSYNRIGHSETFPKIRNMYMFGKNWKNYGEKMYRKNARTLLLRSEKMKFMIQNPQTSCLLGIEEKFTQNRREKKISSK